MNKRITRTLALGIFASALLSQCQKPESTRCEVHAGNVKNKDNDSQTKETPVAQQDSSKIVGESTKRISSISANLLINSEEIQKSIQEKKAQEEKEARELEERQKKEQQQAEEQKKEVEQNTQQSIETQDTDSQENAPASEEQPSESQEPAATDSGSSSNYKIDNINKYYNMVPSSIRSAFENSGWHWYLYESAPLKNKYGYSFQVQATTEWDNHIIYVDRRDSSASAIIHELGHWASKFYFTNDGYVSDSPSSSFADCFNSEWQAVCNTFGGSSSNYKTQHEYAAESFFLYITNNGKLQSIAPKTWNFYASYGI